MSRDGSSVMSSNGSALRRRGASGRDPVNHRTSVVSRVMEVLGAFSVDGPQLRAADVARRSGLPYATAHRVLQELVAHEAIERAPGGRYMIGPRLWEIGRLGTQMYRLWSAAHPHLWSLARLAHGRAYVSVLAGAEGLRLDGTTGPAAAAAPCWVVERLPLHATAAGHVLLAFTGPDAVDRTLRAPLTRYTEHTLVSPAELCRLLGDVRRNGFAVSRNQHQVGEVAVAAPVFGPAVEAVGAVEVVLGKDLDVRRTLPAVTRTAHELSQALAAAGRGRRRSSRLGHVLHPVEINE